MSRPGYIYIFLVQFFSRNGGRDDFPRKLKEKPVKTVKLVNGESWRILQSWFPDFSMEETFDSLTPYLPWDWYIQWLFLVPLKGGR